MRKIHEGISGEELRRTLTVGGVAYVRGEVSLDLTIEAEMDKAYLLVKKFERERRKYSFRPGYLEGALSTVDEKYIKGDPEDFKWALEYFLQSI